MIAILLLAVGLISVFGMPKEAKALWRIILGLITIVTVLPITLSHCSSTAHEGASAIGSADIPWTDSGQDAAVARHRALGVAARAVVGLGVGFHVVDRAAVLAAGLDNAVQGHVPDLEGGEAVDDFSVRICEIHFHLGLLGFGVVPACR